MCVVDDTLAWLPGRINLPFVLNGFSTYDNNTGLASWLSAPTTGAQNVQPLTVEDTTKGRKIIDISYDNNKITFDTTTLVNTLNSYATRLMRAPKQIGARINFDSTIIESDGR